MIENAANPKKIFILTGEPSGDLLGARLMYALNKKRAGIAYEGVGGERMIKAGLQPIFPQRDLAVFGLFELLPKIFKILARLKQTVAHVKATKPDVVITIDSPDFSFRVGERLKDCGIPVIHYVAPSVWAWRPKRAKKIAGFLSHLFALFPFEPPYFTKEGLPCTFVGHPIVENGIDRADIAGFRAKYNVHEGDTVLVLLPGSRTSEVKRLLPIFGETLQLLQRQIPNLKLIMPTIPHVARRVKEAAVSWPMQPIIIEDEQEKYAAFQISQAGLCASGTVTLEGALAGMPMVVAYKLSWATVLLYYWLFTIKYFSPVNILLGREAIPERLQHRCKPEILATELQPLLTDIKVRETMRMDLAQIGPMLQNGKMRPSDLAADVVIEYLDGKSR